MERLRFIALLTSVFLVLGLAIMLNRIMGDGVCNKNSSIHQLHIFSAGEIKKVPNCSLISNLTLPKWSETELELILKAQKLENLKAPIVLTIDTDHSEKVEVVADYYWLGHRYFDAENLRHLRDWLFFQSLGNHKESLNLSDRVLQKLNYLLSKNRSFLYSWAKYKAVSHLHLVDLLINEYEYCEEALFDLRLKSFCEKILNSSNLNASNNTLPDTQITFLPAMEFFIAKILKDYLTSAFNVVERGKIIKVINLPVSQDLDDLDLVYKNGLTYSEIVSLTSDIVAKLIKLIHPEELLRQEVLAQVLNKRLLFSAKDLLVINTEDMILASNSMDRGKYDYHQNMLWVDSEGVLFNSYSRLIDVKLGELFFVNALSVGSTLNLLHPAFGHSKFIYITREVPDFKVLSKRGIESYLLFSDEVQFAKLHRESLVLADISELSLEGLEELSAPLGWQGSKEIVERSILLPLANIEGVISYRLNLSNKVQ